MSKKIIITVSIIFALIILALLFRVYSPNSKISTQKDVLNQTDTKATTTKEVTSEFSMPLSDALNRITKKPFGIYITPKNSPVSPEKFTGYHTADDFETTPAEQNIDVPVYAICTGKILVSKFGNGYGGMVVESCTLNGEPITVVYGHVRLTSVSTKVGETIKSGDFLANLGTGYSSETDGERKHLHLGIHKGASIVTSGYVANKSSLSNWIDWEKEVAK